MEYTYQELNEFTPKELNEELNGAAFENDFKYIKILLTSPKLKLHAQINFDSRTLGFICSNKDLKTLKYVLTSPELKEYADIHLDDERALCCAIYVGDIPMIKYLLTSPELKEHSNLYHKDGNNDDICFQWIFKVPAFETSAKIVDYLTLEYAKEKKDTQIFLKLTEYADDIDIEEQITNNLFALIIKEKDESYQLELKKVLKELDIEKYNKLKPYILSKELTEELPNNENRKSIKVKI
jgi:hypothetical protein